MAFLAPIRASHATTQPTEEILMLSSRRLRATPDRPIKRQRTDDDPPLSSRGSLAPSAGVAKTEREQFFDALETAAEFPGTRREIGSPDDLERAELRLCFALLHECGRATDGAATLATTRQSIEGFLEAVFKDWNSGVADVPKPELDLVVGADVVAGRICMVREQHRNVSHCLASDICTVEVSASATYSSTPPQLKLEYNMTDPFTGQGEAICAITRSDITWVTSDWAQTLRCSLQLKMTAKMHRHNKRLAIWQARKMIRGWAKGGLCLSGDVGRLGFLKEDTAKTALLTLSMGS